MQTPKQVPAKLILEQEAIQPCQGSAALEIISPAQHQYLLGQLQSCAATEMMVSGTEWKMPMPGIFTVHLGLLCSEDASPVTQSY